MKYVSEQKSPSSIWLSRLRTGVNRNELVWQLPAWITIATIPKVIIYLKINRIAQPVTSSVSSRHAEYATSVHAAGTTVLRSLWIITIGSCDIDMR
jgi:predicted membrane-bound dolichyl-phosphate-mannose-protein mannosyltransferase